MYGTTTPVISFYSSFCCCFSSKILLVLYVSRLDINSPATPEIFFWNKETDVLEQLKY